MKSFLIKYLIILIFITSFLNAQEDTTKDLNLQEKKRLNRIEGKPTGLKAIKKGQINDLPSIKTKTSSSYSSAIDTSSYKKVKLIDAVLETLSHSDLLKSAREKVIQYELKVKNAMANYYPTLDFEYNYGKTRTSPSGEDDGPKFKYYDDKNYRFILRQNLYAGGSTGYEVSSVSKKLEVAKNQYRITLDEEIKKSIKAYFGVVFSNRSVIVSERNMKKLNKILEIITIKYDNGAASIGDLTSIKASVANAMTKLVKVKSKFIESLRYYEYIVGIDFEKTLPYEMNFNIKIGDFDNLFKRTLEQNRDLVNYYKSIEAEKFKQKGEESSFKPNIDFELSYKKTLDTEDLEEEETDINGKVKLTYNIFNGGRDKNKVLEASSSIRDLKYRLEEEKKKVKWNLSKIHTSIQSVKEALDSTITEVKASRKMVSAYWDAFKLGEQDLQVLLQGQKQLNSAETELVKYEQTHATDFFNILEITGDLSKFFDVDPESTKFIDFSKSNYTKNLFISDGKNIDIDLKTGKEKELQEKAENDILKEEEKQEVKEIPLPKLSMDEKIDKFLAKFMKFDDNSYMIEISDFGNIYESFDFIKENNLDSNSFSYDVVNKYNIKTRIAHNNFKTEEEAKEYLKSLESKDLDKKFRIKKVKDIKSLYSKYIDGLKVEVKKVKPKVRIVEKIRQVVKRKEFLPNEEFKNRFLNANSNHFTINISTFTKNEDVENFVLKNDIYNDSFFFKYGDNGQLTKLVYGIYENYSSLENQLNKFTFENENVFPIVEKIGLVRNLYKNNIDFNKKSEKPLEYEYINLSKEELKTKSLKKKKEKEDKKEEILTLTKRPDPKEIKKQELEKIKKKIEEILPSKKDLEAKRIAEENRIAEEKRKLEEKARIQRELEAKRIAEEKVKLEKEKEAKRVAEQKRLAEEKIRIEKELEEKAKLEKEKEAKRLAEEKARIQKELEAKRIVEEKRKLEEKARLKKEAEEKVKLEEEKEAKRIAEQKRLAEEKIRLEKEAEEKRIAEEKAKLEKEKEAKRVAEQKRLAEEKIRIEKELEEKKKIAEEKARIQKELEEKRIDEEKAKRLPEEKAKLEKEAKRVSEQKRLAEEKIRIEKELEEKKKIVEEKAKVKRELEVKKIVEEKRIAEEKRKLEEKARIQKELEAKRIAEENAKLEKEKEAKRLSEQKRLAEEKIRIEKELEEKKKIAEEKARIQKELEAKRIAEDKRKIEEQTRLKKEQELKQIAKEKRIAEEKAKLEKEKEAKRVDEQKRLAEEKARIQKELEEKRITEQTKVQNKSNNIILSNKPIEEIDFANGLKQVKKVPEIPYSQRLKNYKKIFNKTSKNKYTLKLTTIDTNKVRWYAHRFALEPNYITVKKGSKSDIYYGIFDSIEEAKKSIETLHPKIYESKPPVKKIGVIR